MLPVTEKLFEPKFRPDIVTVKSPVIGALRASQNDTTGASNVNRLRAVPTAEFTVTD
jgi:hypothetical protein